MKEKRDTHAKFIGVVLTAILLILCARIYYFQAVWGEEYAILAARQQHSRMADSVTRTIQPLRGNIYDRNMQPLVSTIPVFDIFIDANRLHRARYTTAGAADLEATLEALHRYLHISTIELLTHMETNSENQLIRPTYHRIVATGVEAELAFYLRDSFAHIHATQQSRRVYHDPTLAPQIIGFRRGDALLGLESLYNYALTGTSGRIFMSHGQTEEIPVSNGYSLVLTLDSEIQRAAQNAVDLTYRQITTRDFVAMLVMDPFTGEILAMAQAPTFSIAHPFDPNYITDTWLQENWGYFTESQQEREIQRMWNNFHTMYSYEQGSVFKPIVIAAAMEEGVLSPNDAFYCDRVKYVAGEPIFCNRRHGRLTLVEALYRSCNIAMIYINERLGVDNFYRYRGYFGFGERTGIDLPAELCVSSPLVMYSRRSLGSVEMATSSIGQGFNSTTIQMATAYAALLNGGTLLAPFIVSHMVDYDGNIVYERQRTEARRVLSTGTSDFIRIHMQYVVSSDTGTGRHARVPGHATGGKTGTGQHGVRADNINHLTHVAFMPVDNPQFLTIMMIGPVDGSIYPGAGAIVGPRVADFFQDVIDIRGLQPDGLYAAEEWQNHTAPTQLMPDYSGMRLVDAVRDLNHRNDGGFAVVGEGTIVQSTVPPPGSPMPQTAMVFFNMEPDTRVEGQMVFVPNVTGITLEQANSVLREAGLPPVTLSSLASRLDLDIGQGGIAGRLTPEELAEYMDGGVAPAAYMVYQQFPSAGTEVERGTLVMLRAR